CFLRALGTIVHGGQDRSRGSGKGGPRKGRSDAWRGMTAACAAVALMARIAAFAAASLLNSHPARRCRSSVVEHSLGKGEVVSSILTGSTIFIGFLQRHLALIFATACGTM